MLCPMCDTEIKRDDKFCSGCGIEVRLKDKKTSDYDYQISNIEKIYNDGLLAPVFKSNEKHCGNGSSYLSGFVPRISYDDIMNFKKIIRWCPQSELDNRFWSEETEVIAEYDSISELVSDGWRLD
jgi:hypothetical protein